MTKKGKILLREETITTTYRYSTDFLDKNDWGTWEEFLQVRQNSRRYTVEEKRAKDTRVFGKCIVCKKPFQPDDKIHFTQSVMKNGKCLGNLFSCDDCAEKYGNVDTGKNGSKN